MTNHRLLLIEDDYDVAEMLLMYFQSFDYDVLHADSGSVGIDLARTRFPNLILLDVMLPDMDGYDICHRLRNMSMTRYIPVLFLTQKDERASKVRGLELGADDYITKPFDIDELRLRVQGSIKRATRENLHEARTGLPTGSLIQEQLDQRQLNNIPHTQLIYRIQGYEAYSDVYGFLAANQVIGHASTTIKKVMSELGTSDDFVGIEDNDFIVLTHAQDIEQLDATIKANFAKEIKAFYTFMDVDRGGVLLNEGKDNEYVEDIMAFISMINPFASQV